MPDSESGYTAGYNDAAEFIAAAIRADREGGDDHLIGVVAEAICDGIAAGDSYDGHARRVIAAIRADREPAPATEEGSNRG